MSYSKLVCGGLTILVVDDGVTLNENGIYHISSLDWSNTDTVSTGAWVVRNDDVLSIIDGNAVVLIDNGIAADSDVPRSESNNQEIICTYVIVRSVEEETSNPSVLWPKEAPALLSYVTRKQEI